MFNIFNHAHEKIVNILKLGKSTEMSELEFIAAEIQRWKCSPRRLEALTGFRYHLGDHDIYRKKRTAIGEDGKTIVIENLPNNIRVDNVYGRCVDQKTDYFVGSPITFKSENEAYNRATRRILGKRFHKLLKNVCKDSINSGKSWIFPYINENGELKFKQFYDYEILPFWKDKEHTELEMAVRYYQVDVYEGSNLTVMDKVEVYKKDGIYRYIYSGSSLIPDENNLYPQYSPYIYATYKLESGEVEKVAYGWNKVPLVCFKRNSTEQPLIHGVKSLQDGINQILSDFNDNVQENARNTILVLENYDGQNLGEFRKNLATFGAVKVKTVDGSRGGVKTLSVEVKPDTYKSILSIFKRALLQNAKAYDDEDTNELGEQNSLSILSGYTQLDLDCNEMETEYQESMEDLMWFVDVYLKNKGEGDFTNDEMIIIFDRDLHLDESAIINNCRNSVGIISKRTIISQHPWVVDVDAELAQLKKEEQEERELADPYSINPKKSNPKDEEIVEEAQKDNNNKRPSTLG